MKRFRTLREYEEAKAALVAKYKALREANGGVWTRELDRAYMREDIALARRMPRNPYERECRDAWREYAIAYGDRRA